MLQEKPELLTGLIVNFPTVNINVVSTYVKRAMGLEHEKNYNTLINNILKIIYFYKEISFKYRTLQKAT
jgi:hypothetical protein